MERPSALEVYTEVVLPALQERLDSALPEFGWRRDRDGWVATDQEFTHRAFGVRADRVVAHGPAPRGFLVHGNGSVLWTAYLNGGVVPRGPEFVRTVGELAVRAGVDPGLLERRRPRDRRRELLQAVFALAEAELRGERGATALAYLQERGFPPGAIERCGIGLFPDRRSLSEALERHGYTEAEASASGVLADSRWPGRIVGCWRDEHGDARTLWVRTIRQCQEEGSRYLYLRGAARAGLPPYGLSTVLAGSLDRRRELVLVEGVIDVHALRAHGVENVCALGGTSIRAAMFERLAKLGVENVTLCLDNDRAGRTATVRAIEQATRSAASPTLFVVDPEQLTPAKDPTLGELHSDAQAPGSDLFLPGLRSNKTTPSEWSQAAAATASKPSSACSAPATGNHPNALTPVVERTSVSWPTSDDTLPAVRRPAPRRSTVSTRKRRRERRNSKPAIDTHRIREKLEPVIKGFLRPHSESRKRAVCRKVGSRFDAPTRRSPGGPAGASGGLPRSAWRAPA